MIHPLAHVATAGATQFVAVTNSVSSLALTLVTHFHFSVSAAIEYRAPRNTRQVLEIEDTLGGEINGKKLLKFARCSVGNLGKMRTQDIPGCSVTWARI